MDAPNTPVKLTLIEGYDLFVPPSEVAAVSQQLDQQAQPVINQSVVFIRSGGPHFLVKGKPSDVATTLWGPGMEA